MGCPRASLPGSTGAEAGCRRGVEEAPQRRGSEVPVASGATSASGVIPVGESEVTRWGVGFKDGGNLGTLD